MQVKPNIGILNALIRITIGLSLLSWSTAKLVKRPWQESYLIMVILSAMKVAEGIVRYCPVTDLYQRSQDMNQNNQNNQKQDDQQYQMTPYNPT